jgi:hypothetical protein
MVEQKDKLVISDEIRSEVMKEYFRMRSRKAKHGNTETVLKRGRKRIPDDIREEHKRHYYETVTKPLQRERQREKRRKEKEEAIKNGTYKTKKLGRPRKKVE